MSSGPRPPVRPLHELRVLELAGGIDVAYCTKILVDAGAEVVLVEPSTGCDLRRRTASGAPLDGRDGPLSQFLHAGKGSVVADDDLGPLLARADVVVAGALPVPWEQLHRDHPHLSAVVISPFGLAGPWAGRPATDLTLQAWAGTMAARGDPDREPLMVGGEPSWWFAGAVAAASLLGVLPRIRGTDVGELLDVSVLEATHLEHTMYPVTFASMAGRPFHVLRGGPVPGIEPTRDGWVGFFVITGQQWLDFCSLIERPDWCADSSLFIALERRRRLAELGESIQAWTRSRTTDEIVDRASLLRIPVAPIGTGETLGRIDHFVEERWFVPYPGGFAGPRRPYRFADEEPALPRPAPEVGAGADPVSWAGTRVRPAAPAAHAAPAAPGAGDPLPLAGLRVADFTAFWAGPIVGHFLASLGADVIHIESPRRPDGIRMNSIRSMDDDRWWEWSPLFCGTNTNKRDLAVDLAQPAGRDLALRLLATCDVMVENFSPRVVDQLGLAPDVVLRTNPQIVVVRMPAFGLDGPWRDRVGFAQTIEQASGLAFLTGYPDEGPVIPNGMCDPLAGIHAAVAVMVARAERDRTGIGQVVEAPMIGAALTAAAEQVVEFTAFGRLLTSAGNGSPLMEQTVLRCRGDDEWVAISIPDESVRGTLTECVGGGGVAALRSWCAARPTEQVVDALWSRGVPVAAVVWAHQIVDNPQLRERGFFEVLDHPVCGVHPYVSFPTRFSAGPGVWNRAPSPTLGQHNDEILTALGLEPGDIAALRAQGVVAERVIVGQHGW